MSNNPDVSLNQSKKKSLGRGLGSLFGESLQESKKEHSGTFYANEAGPKEAGTEPLQKAQVQLNEQQRIWSVGISNIHPNPNQPRKHSK